MNFSLLLLLVVGVVAVGSAIMMVTQKHPVMSVLYMLLTLLCIAVLYLFLGAEFVAAIQVLTYAGAIMVLFLFVIMLLNVERQEAPPLGMRRKGTVEVGLGLTLLVLIVVGIEGTTKPDRALTSLNQAPLGTLESIGVELFTNYVFPVEIVSLLLLAAIIGSVALAMKRKQ